MNVKGSRFISFIVILLILSLAVPLQSANLRTEVIIVSLKNEYYIGKLLEVTSQTISVYRDNKVQKIDTNRIKRIGVKRRSRFFSGLKKGLIKGAIIGAVMGISNEFNPDKEWPGFSYFQGGCYLGALIGGLTSFTIPKYKYYSYNSFTSNKKVKFLNQLKKRVRGNASLNSDEGNSRSTSKFALNVGLSPFNLHTNLSFNIGKQIIALKFSGYRGFDIEPYYDLGVLYEFPLINSQNSFFLIGAGVGIIQENGRSTQVKFNIPIEIKYYYMTSKNFGIGIFGLYNFNKVNGIQLGGGIGLRIKL